MRSLNGRLNPRTLVAVVLGLALAAVAAWLAPVPAAAQDQAGHVRDVLERNAAAFERGDMAALDKIWAGDPWVAVFEGGHSNYGWADYRDNHLAPELKGMKNFRYSLSDVRVRVSGETAWATFRYALLADTSGRRVDVRGLGTAVLERRGQEWRIVHWHTSAPRQGPAQPGPTPHKH
jgi:ketosteroid isomerase-like protein